MYGTNFAIWNLWINISTEVKPVSSVSVRYRKEEERIKRLSIVQTDIHISNTGSLVYCSCVLQSENEQGQVWSQLHVLRIYRSKSKLRLPCVCKTFIGNE